LPPLFFMGYNTIVFQIFKIIDKDKVEPILHSDDLLLLLQTLSSLAIEHDLAFLAFDPKMDRSFTSTTLETLPNNDGFKYCITKGKYFIPLPVSTHRILDVALFGLHEERESYHDSN
jgi:hypothetical protein